MDKKSRTKKGMAPKKPSNQLEIKEITNGTEDHNIQQDNLTPEPSGYIVITEVPSDSENHSKDIPSGSVTIEDVGEAEGVNVESAESSDNISQYLDKEEPTIESAEIPTPKKEEEVKTDNGRQERAKSEEPKRKRKLSLESSYSRKSLSKLAIMKKLRDAKEKIKIPKLNLPSLPNLSVLSNPLKQDSKGKPQDKKQSDKKQAKPKEVPTHSNTRVDPNAKPVYVHIPLKPPEGQTDEFSYLEFGEKKPEEAPPQPEPEEPPKAPPAAPVIEISEAFDDQRRFSGDPNDIIAFEILKAESIDLDHETANGLQGGKDFLIIEQEDDAKSETRSMIIFMPEPDEPSLSRAGSRKGTPRTTPSRQGSKKVRSKSAEPENRQDRARSAEPERKRKLSVESGSSRRSLPKLGFLQKLKDAKDKLFTLSRGDSKKAPSKKAKEEESVVKEQPKVEVKNTETSRGHPKYIHIPLKPPPGETDEFSHFEFETKTEEPKATKPEPIKPEEQSSIDSPGSPKAEGVQFIYLTAPSDDEILKDPEIPETPSSESSKNFFESRVNELKDLAKDVVESTSPKSTKKLQSVAEEETPSDPLQPKAQTEDTKEPEKPKKKKAKGKKGKSDDDKEQKPQQETKPETVEQKPEKMVVDEEDGLKLTESAMAKQEQNIKAKEIEQTDKGWKKKVSFKRRSKDDSKDGDYEDIQAPEGEKSVEKSTTVDEQKSKLAVMGNSQSMSVDEEKSYLDEQKIIKSTSLEEDYNRWSKLSDHEYEPVNPPPDNVTPVATAAAAAPTVHVIDTDRGQQKPTSLASSTTSLERRMLGAEGETSPEEAFTVEEMQTEIENKYFAKSEETPSKPQTTVHTVTTGSTSETSKSQSKKSEAPSKFQQAIKTQTDKLKVQTDKFKTKLHEMKKPNIKLPSAPTIKKPNLQKFKFEKPKINLPKMPDTAKITLPTFSLPRKKRSLKQRQLSTESNAGGSKKNYFDFRTYPRLFKKKPKDDLESFSSKSEREVPEFATVPRTKRNKVDEDRWGGRDTIRVPLHPQDSIEDQEREGSVERRMASHMRYEQDIDIDDAYQKENQEIHTASRFSHNFNSRWNHGSFHPSTNQEDDENERNRQVTDLDSPEDRPAPHESFDTNTSKDIHSSESSLGIHRRGVLEEIDSDEFFLRQKGISQDNIEVGMYLSSEIREAFKYPANALADLQREPRDFSYDARASNQSLPETPTKRKVVKKPKRKKTPHVSHEQISFDQDSELDTELPPSRPKRRSRRNKKREAENIIPYQETIAVDAPVVSVLQSREDNERFMYENEQMQGRELPEITLSDPYTEHEVKYDSEEEVFTEDVAPSAPPRKHRSLKSLSYSEHDSILGDVDPDREPFDDVEVYKIEHEYIIPTPDIPPVKPARTLSRSSSKSRENAEELKEVEETPSRPTRTRSQSQSRSHADSLTLEEPCVEELCIEDFRDSMGYAVIDKQTRREPPLPPPRTPPRRKRSLQSGEQRFFTVPRPINDEVPMRPIRNYSTLGPSRPPRRKPPINMTDEEKENVDITQYIEIDEEPNRDLQSGDVIQKMRDRPLPAPPRPPRKTRTLHDTSSQENILDVTQEVIDEENIQFLEEAEVSTQTEPLPDDFLCEEPLQEERYVNEEIQHMPTERRLITPTSYTYEEETITHGSLVVEPLNGAKILPDSELTRRIGRSAERIVPVTRDYDDEETSEIPEEFTKLKDPETVQRSPQVADSEDKPSAQATPPQPSIIERIIERPVLIQPDSSTEVEVLKAQRLQVSDLDVDRLSVNELLASRIVVSEIDSGSIQANEISSKSGALKVGEIELPPALIQQLLERLQAVAQEQRSSGPIDETPAAETSTQEDSEEAGQKKTPFEQVIVETLPPPQRPPRKTEESCESSAPPIDALIEEPQVIDIERIQSDSLNVSETEEIQPETAQPPEPPVRTDSSKRPPPLEPEPDPVSVLDVSQIEENRDLEEQVPQRPRRHAEKTKSEDTIEQTPVEIEDVREPAQEPPVDVTVEQQHMQEPEIDDDPPPRPPQPQVDYIPSQPPASFYALRAQQYVESVEGDIPATPRRRRHQKPRISRSRSSSDESPAPPPSRRRYRSPEPTIPQLTGQLMQACGSAANSSIKRLIAHITNNVLRNGDGQQDLHVIIVILLVLVAGLILLGYGDGKTVHYHHWEFFNPPRDL